MACITLFVTGLVAVLAAVYSGDSQAEEVTWWDAVQVAIIAGFMILLAVLAVHNANHFQLKTVRLTVPCHFFLSLSVVLAPALPITFEKLVRA